MQALLAYPFFLDTVFSPDDHPALSAMVFRGLGVEWPSIFSGKWHYGLDQ
ncbi:hypothetical protein ACFSQE_14090 [Vogesella fluminis]